MSAVIDEHPDADRLRREKKRLHAAAQAQILDICRQLNTVNAEQVAVVRRLRDSLAGSLGAGGDRAVLADAVVRAESVCESVLVDLEDQPLVTVAKNEELGSQLAAQVAEVKEIIAWMRGIKAAFSKPSPQINVAEVQRHAPRTGTALGIDEAIANFRASKGL